MGAKDERIAEIRKRFKNASINEWFVVDDLDVSREIEHPSGYLELDAVASCYYSGDAQFIAHAKRDIEYLLRLVGEEI